MIPVPSGVRVWLATGHTDMRKAFDGLALLVQETLRRDPHLARISHTFCDTEAVWSGKVSRCKSLTVAGPADPFRQSVFQPSAGRLMDIS